MAFGELMHEPRARFTVRRMMGAVALLSLGIAGLRSPSRGFASAIFTLTTLILLISIICVAYHKGPRRDFWRGFAVFGCGHQFVAFWTATGSGNPPILLTSALFDVARDLLRDGALLSHGPMSLTSYRCLRMQGFVTGRRGKSSIRWRACSSPTSPGFARAASSNRGMDEKMTARPQSSRWLGRIARGFPPRNSTAHRSTRSRFAR